MKITSVFHLLLGMFLSGCTYNTTVVSTSSENYYSYQNESKHDVQVVSSEKKVSTTPTAGCEVYRPPEIGKPKQINLDQIKNAPDDAHVNKLLLDNIAQLHAQIKNYQKLQQAHYEKWRKQCAKH